MPCGASVQGLLVLPARKQKSQDAVPTRKRKSIYDSVIDTEMVERVFGFLPSVIGGQEGQSPRDFEVRWMLSFRGLAWQGIGGPRLVPDLSQPLGSLRSRG